MQDERDQRDGHDAAGSVGSGDAAGPVGRRRAGIAGPATVITGVGIVLGVAFFPVLYSRVTAYDDEGYFLAVLRQFLRHGSLYANTKSTYGPFYFSFVGALYKLTGQSPTLFTGRFIVLVLTVLSVMVFGAAVWRVTGSVLFAALCEVVTFGVLIAIAGNEPLHPGSLIVLLLAVLVYALSSYATDRRGVFLWVVGGAVGALLMTKINVGAFAAVAVIVAFVVGNDAYTKWVRTTIAGGAVLVPFVLMAQKLWQVPLAEFAVLVSLGLVATYVSMHADGVSLPRRDLLVMAESAVAVMVLSCVWPVLDGSGPAAIFTGVLIRPLRQAGILTSIAPVDLDWIGFLVTGAVVLAVLGRRHVGRPKVPGPAWLAPAALGAAGLFLLGLATVPGPRGVAGFLAWLPGIAMLPALAWIGGIPAKYRLVMRFLVPLAILQILHVYPVAGSQLGWGVVTVCVPCVLAMAFAAQRLPVWKRAKRGARTGAVAAVALVVLIGGGAWPITVWHNYSNLTPLDLRGARLVRVAPGQARTLQGLTHFVDRHCDTFYSAPGIDSLYIYTGLPAPTGLLSNWPGALTTGEQQKVADQLTKARMSGERVCIVRNLIRLKLWLDSSYGAGPLGRALAPYSRRIGKFAQFTVSVYAPPGAG